MGPELEQKFKSENIHSPAFSGQKVLELGTNHVAGACDMEMSPIEQNHLSSGKEDVEVNITGCTNAGKALMVEDSCEDATECSSSFGDTGSGTENASSFSDTEVESRLRADNGSSSMCQDWCGSLGRRKKRMTTTHWRRFIGPLKWRCKWIELKLKQLQSQELKYGKELAAYNYTKQLDFAHLTLDGFDIKSTPISSRMHRNKAMKRNKRKRVEEECDLASYMSNHNVFSYFEKSDRTADACLNDFHGIDIGGNDDNNQEFELDDVWSSIEYENIDKSLDDVIQKIEAVQSQVHGLKTRIGKVVSENQGNLGPSDRSNQSDLNYASLAGNENTTWLQSEYHMGDLLMHGNASSSRERLSPIIEISDGSEFEDPWEDLSAIEKETKDGVLVQNHAVKEELYAFEDVRNHLVQKTNASFEEVKSISQVQVSEPDLAAEIAVLHNEHSSLKSCSTMKSKKKRKGREKYSLKRWRAGNSGF
ncbi:hypothetical protein RIF29_18284 [Crotalaria pallida]|uniref:Uncharacterized protein n=1 Tax=Crotalaria pallida TaxID=3830 RepID=A0AAN9IG28_CROPI